MLTIFSSAAAVAQRPRQLRWTQTTFSSILLLCLISHERLDSELVGPYHQEPATEYGTRNVRQREAKERLEDAVVDMMVIPIAASIKPKKMPAWATPAERSRRLRARSDSTDPEHGRGPPTQIDVDRYRRSAAVLCYMTPTTEEKYDNGPGPKRIEGRYAKHSSTRKVAAGLPKK